MSGIAAVIEQVVLATVINGKILSPAKSRVDWALVALSCLLAGAGVFFLVLSLHRYLESVYPPAQAALATGLSAMAFAVLAGIVAWYLHQQKQATRGIARVELGKNIKDLIESLTGELDDPVRENPKTAVAIAALTGFFAGSGRFRP